MRLATGYRWLPRTLIRSPRCELDQLLVRAVVVPLPFVQLGDAGHLLVGEPEIEDVQVVPYVGDVPAPGDDDPLAERDEIREEGLQGRVLMIGGDSPPN